MSARSLFTKSLLRGAGWGCALLIAFAGCVKKGGEAIVIEKIYVPSAPMEGAKPEERQATEEQWKVKVEMRADLRKFDVLVDHSEWDKLKEGDRVNVQYSQGKYTGTIWASDLK